mgnify:CR=1 FL=1
MILLKSFQTFGSSDDTHEFDIPFNRQELANHLCVDRSALSTELNKLQKEVVVLKDGRLLKHSEKGGYEE